MNYDTFKYIFPGQIFICFYFNVIINTSFCEGLREYFITGSKLHHEDQGRRQTGQR